MRPRTRITPRMTLRRSLTRLAEVRHSLDAPMIDWLRFLLMIFYAPARGMRGMRDRGSLAPVVLIAFAAQFAFGFAAKRFAGATGYGIVWELFHTTKIIAIVAIVLVPILTLVAN